MGRETAEKRRGAARSALDESGRAEEGWRLFLMGERDRTIARLRQIERLLGMEQTIPERRR